MALSKAQARVAARILKGASDEYIRLPLWEFHPYSAPLILHERRVRWGVPSEDDFDPEYS